MDKYEVDEYEMVTVDWSIPSAYVQLGTHETTFAEYSVNMDYCNDGNIVTEPFPWDDDTDYNDKTDVLVGYRGEYWLVDPVNIYYDAFDNAWALITQLIKPVTKCPYCENIIT